MKVADFVAMVDKLALADELTEGKFSLVPNINIRPNYQNLVLVTPVEEGKEFQYISPKALSRELRKNL